MCFRRPKAIYDANVGVAFFLKLLFFLRVGLSTCTKDVSPGPDTRKLGRGKHDDVIRVLAPYFVLKTSLGLFYHHKYMILQNCIPKYTSVPAQLCIQDLLNDPLFFPFQFALIMTMILSHRQRSAFGRHDEPSLTQYSSKPHLLPCLSLDRYLGMEYDGGVVTDKEADNRSWEVLNR